MIVISDLSNEYNCFSMDSTDTFIEYSGNLYKSVLEACIDQHLPESLSGFLKNTSSKDMRKLYINEINNSCNILEDIYYAKFTQNSELAQKLIETGDTIIAVDMIGYPLMCVRERLSKRYQQCNC